MASLHAALRTLDEGEEAERACDRDLDSPAVVLGLDPDTVLEVVVRGRSPARALGALRRRLT